jgi:hypothetical protein
MFPRKKTNKHPIVYNAGLKKRHSVPSFQFPKVVLGQPWAAFIICMPVCISTMKWLDPCSIPGAFF